MATGSLQLGGNLSVAVGPLGRSAEASGALNSSGKVAAMFSYSKSQGLFGGESSKSERDSPLPIGHASERFLLFLSGISLEGTILVDRSDANHKAYGRGASAKQILSGNMDPPSFAMSLIDTIERLSLTGRMSEADRADELEPGAGRDSWDMDDDRSSEQGGSGRAGNNDSGIDSYFSRTDLNSQRRPSDRGDITPGASRKSPSADLKPKRDERDPFATSEDEETYSMDRENATRNAGTYAFSTAGGGSATNSPKISRGGSDYGRSQSFTKSGSKSPGYFDDYSANAKEKRMSPVSSKRPSFGHRKSSSSFSLSRFGIGKGSQTPPAGGLSPSTSRKTPPPGSLLNNDFQQSFTRSSESEDDYGLGSSDNYGRRGSDNDPYTNGGLKKTTAADAIRAAAGNRGDYGRGSTARSAGLSSTRQQASKADAFGDLWNSERAKEELSGMDPLDRELQSGIGSSKRSSGLSGSISNDYYGPNPHSGVFSSPQRPASGSQVDRTKFSKSPTFLSKSFRTGSSNGARSKSYTQEITSDASDHDDDREGLWRSDSKESSSRDAMIGNGGNGTSSSSSRMAAYLRGGPTSATRTSSHTSYPSSPPSASANSSLEPSLFDDDFETPAASAPSNSTYSSSPTSTRAAGTAAASRLPSQGRVVAAFDFQAQEPDDLPLTRGEVIVVLKKSANVNDWWLGRNASGQVGSFPGNYVESVD